MTEQQKTLLLKVAREAVLATVSGSCPPPGSEQLKDTEYGGAFVTLRRESRLRGCMGTFSPKGDILATVQEVAISASRDQRFVSNPIEPREVPELNIEVSILSHPVKTENPLTLELGVHGILIENPKGQGCFLPQVATEFGWDKEEFLRRCCRDKALLDQDAWKDPATAVHLFTTEAFREG